MGRQTDGSVPYVGFGSIGFCFLAHRGLLCQELYRFLMETMYDLLLSSRLGQNGGILIPSLSDRSTMGDVSPKTRVGDRRVCDWNVPSIDNGVGQVRSNGKVGCHKRDFKMEIPCDGTKRFVVWIKLFTGRCSLSPITVTIYTQYKLKSFANT